MDKEHDLVVAKLQKLVFYIMADINSSKDSGKKLKNKAIKLKIAIISVSSLVTIALGLNVDSETMIWGVSIGKTIKNLAVILSAGLTALNTWDAFMNYFTRSTQETSIVSKLTHLYKEIYLHLESNTNCRLDEYNGFKKKYDNIHEEYTQERNSLGEKDKEEKKPDK